jgi:hypothetical protein
MSKRTRPPTSGSTQVLAHPKALALEQVGCEGYVEVYGVDPEAGHQVDGDLAALEDPIAGITAQKLRLGFNLHLRKEYAERGGAALRDVGVEQVGDQAPATVARFECAHEGKIEIREYVSDAFVDFNRSPTRSRPNS